MKRIWFRSTPVTVSAVGMAILIAGCGAGDHVDHSAAAPTATSPRPSPTRSTTTGTTVRKPTATPTRQEATASGRRLTTTLGSVESRTRVADGYRIALQPAKRDPASDSFAVIPGPARTYLVPRSFVPSGGMLVGDVEVTADGERVTAISIVGG